MEARNYIIGFPIGGMMIAIFVIGLLELIGIRLDFFASIPILLSGFLMGTVFAVMEVMPRAV